MKQPEPMKEKKPDKPKTVKKSKCSKAHPEPPCKENQYSKPPSGCCYKKKIPKKASIRKKSTIRKKHKRKNNKRTIRKRGR